MMGRNSFRDGEQEELAAQDGRWFRAHRDRKYRARFAVPDELPDLDRFGGMPLDAVAVLAVVIRLSPGFSRATKIIPVTALTAHPDNLGDHQLARLCGELEIQRSAMIGRTAGRAREPYRNLSV